MAWTVLKALNPFSDGVIEFQKFQNQNFSEVVEFQNPSFQKCIGRNPSFQKCIGRNPSFQNRRTGAETVFENSIFIEGTTAIGKTTVLKQVAQLYDVVHFTDYYELTREYPWTLRRSEDTGIGAATVLLETSRFLKSGPSIFDRSPLSSIIFGKIFHKYSSDGDLNMSRGEISELVDLCRTIVSAYNLKDKIKIFLESDEELLVHRMYRRQNGIDILDVKYVRLQNRIYRKLAKAFDFEIFNMSETSLFLKTIDWSKQLLTIERR